MHFSSKVSIWESILQTILSNFLIYLLFRSSQKKTTMTKLLFMSSGDRPASRQLTVACIAGRAAAAAVYCRDRLTLSAPVRCGAIGGGGRQQGADASYYPAEAESVCFHSLIHSYDNTIGP